MTLPVHTTPLEVLAGLILRYELSYLHQERGVVSDEYDPHYHHHHHHGGTVGEGSGSIVTEEERERFREHGEIVRSHITKVIKGWIQSYYGEDWVSEVMKCQLDSFASSVRSGTLHVERLGIASSKRISERGERVQEKREERRTGESTEVEGDVKGALSEERREGSSDSITRGKLYEKESRGSGEKESGGGGAGAGAGAGKSSLARGGSEIDISGDRRIESLLEVFDEATLMHFKTMNAQKRKLHLLEKSLMEVHILSAFLYIYIYI